VRTATNQTEWKPAQKKTAVNPSAKVEAVTWMRSRRILQARVTPWRVPTLGETERSGQLIAKSSSIAEFAHQAYHNDTGGVNDDSPFVFENGHFAAIPGDSD
jgi:hypothetical protein